MSNGDLRHLCGGRGDSIGPIEQAIYRETVYCLVCDCELKLYEGSGDCIESGCICAAENATVWRTTGNFGSTLYDPIGEECSKKEFIEAYVCDSCLKKKAKTHRLRSPQDAKGLKYIKAKG